MKLHLKWREEGVEGGKFSQILIVKALSVLDGIFMAQYLVAFFFHLIWVSLQTG